MEDMASLIILELIVKCDGSKCALMFPLLKIYSDASLRSEAHHLARGQERLERIFIFTPLPRRENASRFIPRVGEFAYPYQYEG